MQFVRILFRTEKNDISYVNFIFTQRLIHHL